MTLRFALPILALLATLIPGSPRAESASPWADDGEAAVRLLSASEAVGNGSTVRLGAEFSLKDGWKIYWRSPGDAGFPPQFDWAGSENLADATIRWPVPERFEAVGFETLGYKDSVILPIDVTLARPGQPLDAVARLEYLACKDVCIPFEARVELALPGGPADPSPHAHAIDRFDARVPGDGQGVGLTLVSAALNETGGKTVLVIEAISSDLFTTPDVLVEGPRELFFLPPRTTLSEERHKARLEVPVEGLNYLESPLPGRTVTVTLIDGDRAAERALAVAATEGAAPPAPPAGPSLAVILALALLGGLILNVMPCVLPVLSIKLLGVIGHGGGRPGPVRIGFIASAVGILFSFMVLASALIALKAVGASIGWGIQFQHPWFLTAMVLIVAGFACNLWGFFEIPVPGWLSNVGGGHGSEGIGGHFLTGAFATLMATPCSAPFLGSAVGFALSRGTTEILSVFAALGLGLSLPYLAVAAFPGLATRLPRPGRWMIVTKKVLAVALIGTAIWLLSILAAQTSATTAWIVGGFAAAMGLGLALRPVNRWAGPALASISLIAALAAPAVSGGRSDPVAGDGPWRPFDEAAIPALVASGSIVFVDVTADWCITCKVNKKIVLADADTRDRLFGDGVVAMQADWTRPDEGIARYLAKHGRYGIPFNIVYGPGAPGGRPLPELLTPATVIDALSEAARRPAG